MSEASPCLNGGACCSHCRVSFFWGECASVGGSVPDDLVASISPSRVAMLSTDCKPTRCTALTGQVGNAVNCGIYQQRSSTCREFAASWVGGERNIDCDAARAAFGLSPLEQPINDACFDYEQSA